jgi:hypothetical protein
LRTSDSTSSILRTNYADFLTTWIDLYAINDVLYVTNSCEPEGFYLLTDSLFYDGYNMDAPDISIIKSSQIDAEIDYINLVILILSVDLILFRSDEIRSFVIKDWIVLGHI